ncbi:hypothetical protein V8F06_004988 [Rhypophila decipiens]
MVWVPVLQLPGRQRGLAFCIWLFFSSDIPFFYHLLSWIIMMGSLVCGIFLSRVQHDISFLLVSFLACQQLYVRRWSNRCSQCSYCMLGAFAMAFSILLVLS